MTRANAYILPPALIEDLLRSKTPGAHPKGTRVCKVNGEPGDRHPTGSTGSVLASMPGRPDVDEVFYLIAWDDAPAFACFTHGQKIERMP